MNNSDMLYTIVVGVDASEPALRAFEYAADLALHIPNSRLIAVYVVGLNKLSCLPYIDNLDKISNLEIQETAKSTIEKLKHFILKFQSKIQVEFKQIQGEGVVELLLEQYLDTLLDCRMVVLGSNNHNGLQKMIYGSVSSYAVQNLKYPVTIVK